MKKEYTVLYLFLEKQNKTKKHVIDPNRCWVGKAVSLIKQSDIFKEVPRQVKMADVHCSEG